MFPTRMTLAVMKGKLKGATQGYTLLKRKSEALTKRFREITKRIDEVGLFWSYCLRCAALAALRWVVGDVW